MTWALRRQIFYVGILLVFLVILAFLVSYPYFHKAPTCFDSRQNGSETGIDCGGSCALSCVAELDKISILWSRAFRVVPGRYNAVAYLENKNENTAVKKIHYQFRFADKDNIYIGKREGDTFIPPAGRFAVFAPAIGVGNSVPVYTTFEFTEEPVWLQVPPEQVNQLKVFASNIQLIDESTSPKLSTTIKNNSLFTIPNVSVVAILYDALHNAVSVSQTHIDVLSGEEAEEVNFTWPEPIPAVVVFKEIIPMYDIFSVKLR